MGAVHLLRLAREFGLQRLVVAGQLAQTLSERRAADRRGTIEPTTAHGAAKAAATLICRQAALETGVPVYRSASSTCRSVGNRVTACCRPRSVPGSMAPLPLTGRSVGRDWVFVADVVDAVLRAASLDRSGEVINVGSGEHSNEALFRQVRG